MVVQRSLVGWQEISPAALRRLRNEMSTEDGVVDEVGVLQLHTGYADRFFPGTSVLHTRIRYLFFTCWNYERLSRRKSANSETVVALKEKAESWVKHRLLEGGETKGVIGRRLNRPPAQPVDAIYWTALKEFGFYRGPARSVLMAHWGDDVHVDFAADERPEEYIPSATSARFQAPPAPSWWRRNSCPGLTFDLSPVEAEFLRDRLRTRQEPTLLSEAAELVIETAPTKGAPNLWSCDLLMQAAERRGEVEVVRRAELAAELARWVRLTYAALVEQVLLETVSDEERVDYEASGLYQVSLREALDEHWDAAQEAATLDLVKVAADLGGLSPSLLSVLECVGAALRSSKSSKRAVQRTLLADSTRVLFETVELRRKGLRARLPRTPAGRVRRAELLPKRGQTKLLQMEPLHYRWRVVAPLLMDLHEGLQA